MNPASQWRYAIAHYTTDFPERTFDAVHQRHDPDPLKHNLFIVYLAFDCQSLPIPAELAIQKSPLPG